jgi:Holliday junction DNA helicase RuvA
MIEFLRGTMAYFESEYIVLDVNGVGYQVFCPHPHRFAAATELTIYIHDHVREDAHLLYGFANREELHLFRQLLEVSGIGPKVALGVLAGGSPQEVLVAIQQENLAFLTRLPGIGRKTAQRMILDLKDRTKGMALGMAGVAPGSAEMPAEAADGDGNRTVWNETKEALRGLGYSEVELVRVRTLIGQQPIENETVDQMLKRALKWLYAGI